MPRNGQGTDFRIHFVRDLRTEYSCRHKSKAQPNVSQSTDTNREVVCVGEKGRECGEHQVINTIYPESSLKITYIATMRVMDTHKAM
jgi:hypothetical protein